MTKGVKICIAAAVVIFAAALVGTVLMLTNDHPESRVVVILDGERLMTLDPMTDSGEYRVESANGGYNLIKVEGGRVRISEADCPDNTCVKMGALDSDVPIVCLPHKLIVRFDDES